MLNTFLLNIIIGVCFVFEHTLHCVHREQAILRTNNVLKVWQIFFVMLVTLPSLNPKLK